MGGKKKTERHRIFMHFFFLPFWKVHCWKEFLNQMLFSAFITVFCCDNHFKIALYHFISQQILNLTGNKKSDDRKDYRKSVAEEYHKNCYTQNATEVYKE